MNEPIPPFEGHPVDSAVVKMTGAAPLDDLADVVLGVDDRVQLLSMFTCVGVRHEVDKNGDLQRVHLLRPVEMSLAPFGDDDDGILRLPVSRAVLNGGLYGGERVNTETGEIGGTDG